MKNLISFLLLIAVAVTTYVLLDDRFQEEEDNLNSIQYGNVVSSTTPTPSTGSNTGETEIVSTINSFTANGTEPFWAAEFSGTTLVWQNPDLGSVIISGLLGPVASGSSLVWTDTGSMTNILITPGSCNNGMSEEVFSGSISLVLSGQTWLGCASY